MRIVLEVLLDDEQVTPHMMNSIRTSLQNHTEGVLHSHKNYYGAKQWTLDYEVSVRVEVDE